jgi:hypothetical protein
MVPRLSLNTHGIYQVFDGEKDYLILKGHVIQLRAHMSLFL